MPHTTLRQVDITIVGGGISGAVLALALASLKKSDGAPLTILLVEATVPTRLKGDHPSFDSRAIALSAGSCYTLHRLGLWPLFAPHVEPITDIHVSDRGYIGFTELSAADYNLAALGYVIELAAVGQALQHAIANHPQIQFVSPATLTSLTQHDHCVEMTLSGGERYQTRLLVGADGAYSSVRTLLNLAIEQTDYQQQAIIATVKVAHDLNGRAFERFTPHGPLALLPMQHGLASLVWCVNANEVDELASLDEHAFLQRLQDAFGWRVGHFQAIGARSYYPLSLTAVDYPLSHRTVLVGNAAHTLHPIAGQGFNLGVRDLERLTYEVMNALEEGGDIGSFAVLNRYWQQRKEDQRQTIDFTSTLVTLFSNEYMPLTLGRSVMLLLMARVSPFKARLVARGLGFATQGERC